MLKELFRIIVAITIATSATDCAAQMGSTVGGDSAMTVDHTHTIDVPWFVARGASPTELAGSSYVIHDDVVEVVLELNTGDFSVSSTLTGQISIEPLPIGTYTLNLLVAENGGPHGVWASNSLQVVAGTPQTRHPIAALSPVGLALVGVGVMLIGVMVLAHRRQSGY